MRHFIENKTDVFGGNYLAINIHNQLISKYEYELMEELTPKDYESFTNMKKERNGDSYHITVLNTPEYKKTIKKLGLQDSVESMELVYKYEIDDLKFLGLGKVERDSDVAYFVVVKSDKLDAVRKRFDLPQKDFHITLAFRFNDIHGVPKNEVLSKKSKLIKLISKEYYKDGNFNFVKDIKNYDGDFREEIIPIKITDNRLKVKCGDYYLEILEVNDNLYIGSKYSSNDDLPRLSTTEINKILN